MSDRLALSLLFPRSAREHALRRSPARKFAARKGVGSLFHAARPVSNCWESRDCGMKKTPDPLRRGFTIAEVLIVLAVLLVASGLVFPPLLRIMADQPLKEAAEKARSQLANVRLKALDSGVAWQFRFEPGGKHLLWMPLESQTSTDAAANATAVTPTAGIDSTPQTTELPKGVVFATALNGAAFGSERLSPEQLAGLPDSYALTQVGWSFGMSLQPDGSTADFEFAVVDARDKQIRLTVRGLTGGITVSSIETRSRR